MKKVMMLYTMQLVSLKNLRENKQISQQEYDYILQELKREFRV